VPTLFADGCATASGTVTFEVSDGAGDVGFFSPGSYWPITVAACAALVGISLAFFYVWALVIAGIMLLMAVGGLVFEYHIRPADH